MGRGATGQLKGSVSQTSSWQNPSHHHIRLLHPGTPVLRVAATETDHVNISHIVPVHTRLPHLTAVELQVMIMVATQLLPRVATRPMPLLLAQAPTIKTVLSTVQPLPSHHTVTHRFIDVESRDLVVVFRRTIDSKENI